MMSRVSLVSYNLMVKSEQAFMEQALSPRDVSPEPYYNSLSAIEREFVLRISAL